MRTRRFIRSIAACSVAVCFVTAGCAVPSYGPDHVYTAIGEATGHVVPPPKSSVEGPHDPLRTDWSPSAPLTEADAVATALRNNADFAASLEDLGIAKADWRQAGMLRNPDAAVLLRFFVPGFGYQSNSALLFPTELGGQIFFRRRIAELAWRRTAGQLIHAGTRLVADVRAQHAELATLTRKAELNAEGVRTLESAARIARRRLEAGDAGAAETALADADLARVRTEGLRIARDAAAARERMNALMGLDGAQAMWTVPAPPAEEPATLPGVDELTVSAAARRFDVVAADADAEAAAERIGLEWANVLPTILLGPAEQSGTGQVFQIGPSLQFPLPIFDQNQARIARADAETRKALLTAAAVRVRVAAEVRLARANWERTAALLAALRGDLRPKLETALTTTERAFAAGQEPYSTVLAARRALIEVRMQEADEGLVAARARIELERAAGGRLP